MAFTAFYDANVLLPHEVRDILMISASTRLHAVCWSQGVFEEWTRNSVGKGLATVESVLRFQDIMNRLFPNALILEERYLDHISQRLMF